jgi:dUTP pyrophosphatase
MIVKYKLVEANAKPPFRKYATDAGIDLCVTRGQLLSPGETAKLSTGLSFELPSGTYGDIRARSSTTLRRLLVTGVVDEQYRGTVYLLVTNPTYDCIEIAAGERLGQMIVTAIPRVELVEGDPYGNTERGADGFGSSGRT